MIRTILSPNDKTPSAMLRALKFGRYAFDGAYRSKTIILLRTNPVNKILNFFAYPGVEVREIKPYRRDGTFTPTPTVHRADLWQSNKALYNRGEDAKLNSISLRKHLIFLIFRNFTGSVLCVKKEVLHEA